MVMLGGDGRAKQVCRQAQGSVHRGPQLVVVGARRQSVPVGHLTDQTVQTLWINPLSLLLRNVFFMIVVLTHGFRRLLPPY